MTIHAQAIQLDDEDRYMLSGGRGEACRFAMEMLVRVGDYLGACRLIDISRAHLVGSYYGGPGDLALIEKLLDDGARVVVPTTLNASSADLYQQHLFDPNRTEVRNSCRIVKCYQEMGCRLELTCAPYYLEVPPRDGEAIAWAESNAVVYANSVLGARTDKTFQYLDLCAALTGRIPEWGLYLDDNRRATRVYHLAGIPSRWLANDALFQLLGLCIGARAGSSVPVITGLPATSTDDQLRSLGAAAASSGSLSMFHAVGLTPEAPTVEAALHHRVAESEESIRLGELLEARKMLCTATGGALSAVCLGTPHYSLSEFATLLELLAGQRVAPGVAFHVSTGRQVFEQLRESEMLAALVQSGVSVVTDTCTYHGLLLRNRAGLVMTSSAKWAYYAPGNLGVQVLFATAEECVESALSGQVQSDESFWRV